MNKNKLVFLALLAVLFSACGEKPPVITPAQQLLSDAGYTEEDEVFMGMHKRYVGTVAGKPVVLNMTEYGNEMEAVYYYEHIGKPIDLYYMTDSSTADEKYLVESVRNGSDGYAHWEVVFKADTISGSWVALDGKKRYPILLKENYTNDMQRFGILSIQDTIKLFDSLQEPKAVFKYQTLMPVGKDESSLFVKSVILNDIMQCDTSSGNKMNVCLEAIKQNYRNEYKAISADLPKEDQLSAFNNWGNTQFLAVMYNENNIVVLINYVYEYTGGAHGNYNSNFINIDRADKKVLQLSDVMTVDSAKLLSLLDVQARLHFGLNEKQALTARTFYSELHIPDNFYISNKGITFVYGLYEIASYADGIIELFIPYNKLTDQLTPYFKKRMNLEPVAKK